MMRFVGFVMRSIIIVAGLLVMTVWIVLGIAGLFAWVFVPVGIVLLFSVGGHWIISGVY
jgi:hypothetical protein